MSRPSLALVVVAVLAVSAVAAVGAVTQENANTVAPVVGTAPGEPNHLAMNASEIRRSNTTTLDLDVGSSISTDSSSLQATYLTLQFDSAYENASSEQARASVVSQFVDRLGNGTAALEAREEANTAAYASGSITTERFLRERARIQSRADRLQQTTSDIRDELPRHLGNRLNGVHGRLEVIQGPLSSSAADDLVRGGSGQSIYVEVSESGYTLASISDGEYTRETYLDHARYPVQPDEFANGTGVLLAAQNRAMELYPWVRENQESPNAAQAFGPGIYRVTKGYPGGEMRVYLSGGTTNVFREHQTRDLTSFNTTQPVDRTVESLRLTVNRTYETGPAEIRLRNANTGAPVDGQVTIDDREAISLGTDGREWIVEPRGDVRINATDGTTNVTATFTGI